jgi:hypothetical protein
LQGITLTAALSLVLVCAIPAMAAPITYNYTGSPFNSVTADSPAFFPGEFMTASITLASPLAPNGEYSLVDGGVVQTNPYDCIAQGIPTTPCDGVVSWSIGDPTDTLSSAGGNLLYQLYFQTDAEGNIWNWDIDAFASTDSSQLRLHSSGALAHYESEPGGQDYDESTYLYDNDLCCQTAYANSFDVVPGTWSEEESAPTPEPGTLSLLFVGLAAGALKRKGRGRVGGLAVRSRIYGK